MINFCIGLLVGLFGINLIDSLNNILAQVTKHICTKIAYKDYLIEKELQEAELPPENTCCIGFQALKQKKNITRRKKNDNFYRHLLFIK